MRKYCINSSSNICFGYLLESPQRVDSNKYPKHMFCEEIRTKQSLSYILFCPLRILYNSKFIIMATFFGNKCCRCNEGSLYLTNRFLLTMITLNVAFKYISLIRTLLMLINSECKQSKLQPFEEISLYNIGGRI